MKRDINAYTREYSDLGFEAVMVEYRMKQVLEFVNNNKHKTVLEVGCGLSPLFCEFSGYEQYILVEPSADFCQVASLKASNNPRVEIIQDFLENIVDYLKSYRFDIIIVSGLLHEVPDPNLLVRSIYSCASKETLVHFNVPNNKSFHMLLAYESGLISELGKLSERAKLLQQNTSFDLDLLNQIVVENGFEVVDKGSYFIKIFNHEKMYNLLKNRIVDEKVLSGFDKMIQYMPHLGAEIYVNAKKLV